VSAPNVYYFPPQQAGQHTPFIKYDLAQAGFSAEAFAAFLSRESNHRIVVKRPTDYVKLGGQVFLGLGALVMLKLLLSNVGLLLRNKYVWAAISIGSILTMTSGFMWNRIRNPPYVMPGKNGEVNYIGSG
jgi:oligosaccharyltransferase complex subunit gamma